jgi:hypothetical protein
VRGVSTEEGPLVKVVRVPGCMDRLGLDVSDEAVAILAGQTSDAENTSFFCHMLGAGVVVFDGEIPELATPAISSGLSLEAQGADVSLFIPEPHILSPGDPEAGVPEVFCHSCIALDAPAQVSLAVPALIEQAPGLEGQAGRADPAFLTDLVALLQGRVPAGCPSPAGGFALVLPPGFPVGVRMVYLCFVAACLAAGLVASGLLPGIGAEITPRLVLLAGGALPTKLIDTEPAFVSTYIHVAEFTRGGGE